MKVEIKPETLALVDSSYEGIRESLRAYLELHLHRAGLAVKDAANPNRENTPPVPGASQLLNAEAFAEFEAEAFMKRDIAADGKEMTANEFNVKTPGMIDPFVLWFEFRALSSRAPQPTLQRWIASRTMMERLALRSLLEINAETFSELVSSAYTAKPHHLIPGLPEALK